jgi:hypothetical protein
MRRLLAWLVGLLALLLMVVSRRHNDRMRMQRAGTIDPILQRTFGWLRDLGFTATRDPNMTVGATFVTDAVVVRALYHWHDQFAIVTIARRTTPEPGPYWAQVHLQELMERVGIPGEFDGVARDERFLEDVFARGAALLREAASDQLAGNDLEVLDEIIAKRPHRGVPGLDYPVTEPWASFQEGLWFTTDFSGPPPKLPDAIDASKAPDATTRATAALRLHAGLSNNRGERAAALERLIELLADPDLDVRRAAASTLSEWRELSVVDPILKLLDAEAGDTSSPFAAAATFLAIGGAPELRRQVRDALDRFASRGRPAHEQVAELRWRLAGRPPRYPRVSRQWQPGPK